jgi:cupin fold WbuC family metalloprotein
MRELNDEVLIADEPIVTLTREDIATLKARASRNARRRIRVCAHKSIDDAVHEMLIVMARGCYIRPHRHMGKSESFHVVEGALDVVVFDDAGAVVKRLQLGDYTSGRGFYYRNDEPSYHTVVIRSAVVVLHESTRGPFRPSDTIFAPWAPDETDGAAVAEFLATLGEANGSTSAGPHR